MDRPMWCRRTHGCIRLLAVARASDPRVCVSAGCRGPAADRGVTSSGAGGAVAHRLPSGVRFGRRTEALAGAAAGVGRRLQVYVPGDGMPCLSPGAMHLRSVPPSRVPGTVVGGASSAFRCTFRDTESGGQIFRWRCRETDRCPGWRQVVVSGHGPRPLVGEVYVSGHGRPAAAGKCTFRETECRDLGAVGRIRERRVPSAAVFRCTFRETEAPAGTTSSGVLAPSVSPYVG